MDRSVREAIRLLTTPDVDALIVVDGPSDKGGSFIGILTEREIFRAMVDRGLESLDSLVWMFTKSDFVSTDIRTPLSERLQLFCAHKTNHIAIMDGLCLHSIQNIWDCVADAPHASATR
jgi:CBS domain-containing protein